MAFLAFDCAISRVLMTQIGLVVMVEQAPALKEAYTSARNRLPIQCKFEKSGTVAGAIKLTSFGSEESLCLVVDSQIYRPCGYVS